MRVNSTFQSSLHNYTANFLFYILFRVLSYIRLAGKAFVIQHKPMCQSSKTFAYLAMMFALCLTHLEATGRYALVIGNADYENVQQLHNPVHDAKDMASDFQKLGFDTTCKTDLEKDDFSDLLKNFESKVKGADMVVVYYSGHGAQHAGHNYLIPTDFTLDDSSSFESKAIPASQIMADLASADIGTFVLILDACRNDPTLAQAVSSRGMTPLKPGLAPMQAPLNSLVAFATGVNEEAGDGPQTPDGNGVFTGVLKTTILTPGLTVSEVFHLTRKLVVQSTNRDQYPVESDAFIKEAYFNQSLSAFNNPMRFYRYFSSTAFANRICAKFHEGIEMLEPPVVFLPES